MSRGRSQGPQRTGWSSSGGMRRTLLFAWRTGSRRRSLRRRRSLPHRSPCRWLRARCERRRRLRWWCPSSPDARAPGGLRPFQERQPYRRVRPSWARSQQCLARSNESRPPVLLLSRRLGPSLVVRPRRRPSKSSRWSAPWIALCLASSRVKLLPFLLGARCPSRCRALGSRFTRRLHEWMRTPHSWLPSRRALSTRKPIPRRLPGLASGSLQPIPGMKSQQWSASVLPSRSLKRISRR
jgi:hypothetical protein